MAKKKKRKPSAEERRAAVVEAAVRYRHTAWSDEPAWARAHRLLIESIDLMECGVPCSRYGHKTDDGICLTCLSEAEEAP